MEKGALDYGTIQKALHYAQLKPLGPLGQAAARGALGYAAGSLILPGLVKHLPFLHRAGIAKGPLSRRLASLMADDPFTPEELKRLSVVGGLTGAGLGAGTVMIPRAILAKRYGSMQPLVSFRPIKKEAGALDFLKNIVGGAAGVGRTWKSAVMLSALTGGVSGMLGYHLLKGTRQLAPPAKGVTPEQYPKEMLLDFYKGLTADVETENKVLKRKIENARQRRSRYVF